jgi:uncharacterized protein
VFIDNHHLDIVKAILHQQIPQYEVWAFGSRVHGQHLKKFSDLDLVIINDKSLSLDEIIDLKTAFDESDLPFRVDIVEWARLDENFKKIIRQAYTVLQKH